MENRIAAVTVRSSAKPGAGRARAQDVDRHVGARMRERRVLLGLTQQQMAELMGVTYQQAHKYEVGVNRVASGRLHQIAQALGVEVGYFFEGMGTEIVFKVTQQQRLLLELVRNFTSIPNRKHQEAICSLARALSDPDRSSRLGMPRSTRDP
jgi:transcriptional regulator with XRE-family HTH domain